MGNIRPRTLQEVKIFRNIMELMKYVNGIDEATFEKLYNFLKADRDNTIAVSGGTLRMVYPGEESQIVENVSVFRTAEVIHLSALYMSISNPSRSSSGGGGYDGGSSNNNNNNNNNNNG